MNRYDIKWSTALFCGPQDENLAFMVRDLEKSGNTGLVGYTLGNCHNDSY